MRRSNRLPWWIALLALLIAGDAHAQTSDTNGLSFLWPGGSNSAPMKTVPGQRAINMNFGTNAVPMIGFEASPITVAIDNLAQEAGINVLIDPELCRQWEGSGPATVQEPLLTLHWKNITAREAFRRIAAEYDLKLEEDTATTVTFVMPTERSVETLDTNVLNAGTNVHGKSLQTTNESIPMIQFSDVPVENAFQSLFQQAGLNYILDQQMVDGSLAGQYPMVNAHWVNITPQQAILALCKAYNFTLVPEAKIDGVRIQPALIKRHHHLRLR